MTSKFKALTDPTPQSFSGVDIEAKAQPSEPSAAMTTVAKSTRSTTTTPRRSEATLTTGKNVPENSILAAMVLKGVLSRLEKDGLIKRFRLLSKDEAGVTTVKAIRIQFDMSLWTPELNLRLLSPTVVNAHPDPDNSQKEQT